MHLMERKERREMRQIRIGAYQDIDRLNKERCENCRGFLGPNASVKEYQCGCSAATKIRAIGKYL